MRFLPVLVLVALSGCAEPEMRRPTPSRYNDVQITPQSLRTGLDRREVMEGVVPFGISVVVPEHEPFERELPRWDGALRLVRWPSTELVPGAWRLGSVEGIHTFAFEPEAPYEEGWYAVQIDFASIDTRGAFRHDLPVFDGWTTNLFRIGSQPLIRFWGTLSASELDGSRAITFQTTEVVAISAVRRFDDYLEVRVNGLPHRCTSNDVFGPSPMFEVSNPFAQANVACDPVPEGALIEISLREGFFDVPVMDYRGNSPPSWSFRALDNPDNVGPAEDVFLSEDGR